MEAVSTAETSVNFYETVWPNIPGDSHLHSRRRENLKSRLFRIRWTKTDSEKLMFQFWPRNCGNIFCQENLLVVPSSDFVINMDILNLCYQLKINYEFYFINDVNMCKPMYVRALMCVYMSVSYFFSSFCFFMASFYFVLIYSFSTFLILRHFFFLIVYLTSSCAFAILILITFPILYPPCYFFLPPPPPSATFSFSAFTFLPFDFLFYTSSDHLVAG
jgi:hypothetical protein